MAPQSLFASNIVSGASDKTMITHSRPLEVSPKYFADPDSTYSIARSAFILVGDHQSWDRNKAILVQDENGKPALYVICDRYDRCLPLFKHSKRDILAHWQPASVHNDVYTFKFDYWGAKGWQPIEVAIKLKDGFCRQFRVISDLVQEPDWLNTIDVPLEIDRPATAGPPKLPLLAGVIEGPRDMPDCGIRSMPEDYAKALFEGKCPIGLKPPAKRRKPVPSDQ